MRSCYNCGEYIVASDQEGWEMPETWYVECAARPGMANLRSWPFKETKCKAHVLVERVKKRDLFARFRQGRLPMHKHEPDTVEEFPFVNGVEHPKKMNPRAWGGIGRILTCSCGATKRMNRNGSEVEEGNWTKPKTK